jgi:restriction endonuclease S subunit
VQVINAESVKDLEIPLPSIERQEAIAHVAALASRERELENRIAELRRRAIEARLMRHAKDSRRIPG